MYEEPQHFKLLSQLTGRVFNPNKPSNPSPSDIAGLMETAAKVIHEQQIQIRNLHFKIDFLAEQLGKKFEY